jgi:4-amino-4-deoxychorismate lyase
MSARLFRGRREVAAPAPDDRGLAYGDGVFETMRVHRGRIPWWEAHWERLALGASRLGIALPDPRQAQAAATGLFDDGGDGVLKLLLTRGGGGRGYAPDPAAEPAWIISRHALPPALAAGLSLHWCGTRLAIQPALAGIKHCNRLEQVLARAECERAGTDEALVQDMEGRVVSATAANLFVLREGAWTTPPVDRCGVAGTCRAALLAPLGAHLAPILPGEVESADAIFLCNAVRGILPVARLGARTWPPHPSVAAARQVLARLHPGFPLDDPALDGPST